MSRKISRDRYDIFFILSLLDIEIVIGYNKRKRTLALLINKEGKVINSVRNRGYKLKRVISFLLSAILVISELGTGITVSADEPLTPSGIAYSEISSELDAYVRSYTNFLS